MKKLRMRTHSLAFSILGILPTVSSWTCSTQIRGETTYITCPQIGEMGDKIYCCGTEKQRYCCNSEEFASTIYCRNAIGVIIGILVPSIVVVGIVIVVTCFCCSSCLFGKCRQQRGPVVYGNCCLCACPRVGRVNAATTMTTVTYHTQAASYPIYPLTEYTAYPLTETPPPYYSSD